MQWPYIAMVGRGWKDAFRSSLRCLLFCLRLRCQRGAVGGLGAEGEGPAAVIGTAVVAEFEYDGVGAGV